MSRIYFISIFLFFHIINYGQDTNVSNHDSMEWCDSTIRVLKVINIEKVKTAYVIDAQDTCSKLLYRLVSIKKRMKNCNQLKVNDVYEMVIWPYYPCVNIVPNHHIKFNLQIDKHEIIIPSTGWSTNIFLSPDLVGLCYLGDLYP